MKVLGKAETLPNYFVLNLSPLCLVSIDTANPLQLSGLYSFQYEA